MKNMHECEKGVSTFATVYVASELKTLNGRD